ncbi:MAG: hypothetical protein EPN82_05995 [Bacteroidetes bacterium]|nr:MAG: hypothetical protein EPN82_05995 [Bacteroidota bacterium]
MKMKISLRIKNIISWILLLILFFFINSFYSISKEIIVREVKANVDSVNSNPYMIGLGDYITVKLDGSLDSLQQKANQRHKKIIPFIDNVALKGIYPIIIDSTNNKLVFHLKRTETNKDAWLSLLGSPKSFTRHSTFSIGIEDDIPVATAINKSENIISLIVIHKTEFIISLVVMIILIIIFIYLIYKSDIIRINYPDPGEGKKKPYSLCLFQMAFWFFIVLISYIFLWIMIQDYVPIPSSVLVVLGISAITGLLGTSMNQKKINETDVSKLELVSNGFFNDILSDEKGINVNGIGLYRFQNLVWTLIFGIFFLVNVYQNLGLMEFDTSILTLMGISSGTYLGFKFTN